MVVWSPRLVHPGHGDTEGYPGRVSQDEHPPAASPRAEPTRTTEPATGPAPNGHPARPADPAVHLGGSASVDGADTDGLIPVPLKVGSELAARLLIIAAALAVVVWLVIQLRVVVIPVAIALLLTALLAPLVRAATESGVPRGLATGSVLVVGIALFSIVLSGVINAFVAGVPELRDQLIASYNETIKPLLAGPPLRISAHRLNNLPEELQKSVAANSEAITSGALSTAATLTEVISGLLLAFFALIFFLHDGGQIWKFLIKVVPRPHRARVDVAGQRSFASLVGYTRARCGRGTTLIRNFQI